LPEASAIVLPLDAPLRVTVAPLPPAVGLIVPEMLYVEPLCGVAVKLIPETFAPLTVAACVLGVKA
jgi:hypothetical protein